MLILTQSRMDLRVRADVVRLHKSWSHVSCILLSRDNLSVIIC